MLEQSIMSKIETTLYEKALYIESNLEKKDFSLDENLASYEILIIEKEEIKTKKGDIDIKVAKKLLSQKETYTFVEDEELFNAYYILKSFSKKDFTIIVAQKNLPNKAESLEEVLIFLVPLLLLFLILVVTRVIDKILLPINNLTQAASEISIGDFSKSIKMPNEYNELQNLVNAFNKMIDRLKYGVVTMEQFNHDVSHELKTPLTVIKGEVEVTLDRPREDKEYIQSLEVIKDQANHIENIINTLLLLSKYTKENIKKSFEFCTLDIILLQTIQSFQKSASEKDISLHVKKIEPIIIEANAILLGRVFANLIDNALKYSNQNTNIKISLFKDEKIHFLIEDEGIGIPKEKLQFIQERFYRVDSSRNKHIKGYGLGLSIIKNSIELHNGTIQISSEMGIGTKVHITL